MTVTHTVQIRIHETTSKKLQANKLIPTESYDSIINRLLEAVYYNE